MTLIAVTGTPGTGKTSACSLIKEYPVIHLNEVVKEEGFIMGEDEDRRSLIVDLEALKKWIRNFSGDVVIVESHYSHMLNPDIVIVLRTHPEILKERLRKRGFDERKIRENAEAELIDVILVESMERCERVYEIDTTKKTPLEVKDAIISIIKGETSGYEPGNIDWLSEVDIREYIARG